MSLENQLRSLGIPAKFEFPIDGVEPIIVDFLNEEYVIFEQKDFRRLKTDLRMISEPLAISTAQEDSHNSAPPFLLKPEQVSILAQYGYCRVRKLRDDDEVPFDEDVFRPCSSNSAPPIFDSDIQKAKQIAIGRKAKELKRKANGEGANAKQLKIRKQDLAGVVVTEEEVNAILEEITAEKEAKPAENDLLINLALKPNREDAYDYLDYFSLKLPESREYRMREMVFHDLWRRGFYLTTGIRFGCHYLAYEGLPGEVHARFLVECVDSAASLSPLKLITLSRVATQVKKTVLLACVAEDSQIPHYMTLDWFKPYDS